MVQTILNHLSSIGVSSSDIMYTCTIDGEEQVVMFRELLSKYEHDLNVLRYLYKITECQNLSECQMKFKDIVKTLVILFSNNKW